MFFIGFIVFERKLCWSITHIWCVFICNVQLINKSYWGFCDDEMFCYHWNLVQLGILFPRKNIWQKISSRWRVLLWGIFYVSHMLIYINLKIKTGPRKLSLIIKSVKSHIFNIYISQTKQESLKFDCKTFKVRRTKTKIKIWLPIDKTYINNIMKKK